MERLIILVVLAVSMLYAGCTAMKKTCEDSACIDAAIKNNCEEAIYETNAFGRVIKAEVSKTADSCVKVSGTYEGGQKVYEQACTYPLPVTEDTKADCKVWDSRYS